MHPWLVYTDALRVPTYFTMLMVGFTAATFVARRDARRLGLDERAVIELCMVVLPAVLVGARLAHVILEAPRFYREHPWEAFNAAYGGFVFYGGLLSGALVVFAWARRTGVDPWRLGDAFAPATAFGIVFGRLGCLGAGCCYGRPADWPLGIVVPWAIRYTRRGHVPDHLLAVPLHPAPIYSMGVALALFVALSWWRRRQRVDGEVMLLFVAGYGVARCVLEVFRADAERGLFLGGLVSTSQLIGMGSAAAALAVLRWRRRD